MELNSNKLSVFVGSINPCGVITLSHSRRFADRTIFSGLFLQIKIEKAIDTKGCTPLEVKKNNWIGDVFPHPTALLQ